MNKELIMKSDVLDIIFENRNKTYGAYILRKFYGDRLKKALGIMMTVAIVFSAFTFLSKKETGLIGRGYEIPDTKLPTVKEDIKEPVKKQETAKTEAKTTPVNQKIYTNNILVVPKNDKTDTIQTLLPTDVIGTVNIVNAGSGPAIVQPVKTDVGEPMGETTPKFDKTIPRDPNSVDVLPSYPGGMEALRKFLQRNLNNPKDMEEGESVSVKVNFVVGYNGKLQSFVTVQDGGEEFNKEVIRVLKKMPDWIPGKAKGENVSVYYTIPVKFTGAD